MDVDLLQGPTMLTPELQTSYEQLRRFPIFDGIPNAALAQAIGDGGICEVVAQRDIIIAAPQSAADGRIILVAQGQVAGGVFDASELEKRLSDQERVAAMTDDEKEELSLLRPEPLARLAKKNVALFSQGDLFNASALFTASTTVGVPGAPIAFYTSSPAVLATISHRTVADLAVRFSFFETRLRRAVQVSRERLARITGVKQEMLDFFVRHGVSVSGEMVRVRQLDSCIDCKLCEAGL